MKKTEEHANFTMTPAALALHAVAWKITVEENIQLNEKQYIAYETIAYSFLIRLIKDRALQDIDPVDKNNLIKRLKARRGHSPLGMFLTGFAGAGKVHASPLLSASVASSVEQLVLLGMKTHVCSRPPQELLLPSLEDKQFMMLNFLAAKRWT